MQFIGCNGVYLINMKQSTKQKVITINNKLQELVDEFKKSRIQSEAEIRTKLVVPLLSYLGYPSSLRAEEYPVYGFEGRKRLPTKNVDFILFSAPDFAEYRSADKTSITWVQDHSLLVVEAKKPYEMPEILGQPQYYTVWTRALAYFATDGIKLCGCMYQPITSDYEIVSCLVDDLPKNETFSLFSYDNLMSTKIRNQRQIGEIKNAVLEVKDGILIVSDFHTGVERIVSPSDELHLPSAALMYMKSALGQNAVGLNNYSIAKRYLSMTDSYLQNDIRYGAPEYMIHIPRKVRKASLHIDSSIMPIVEGDVTMYYQDNRETFDFVNDNFIMHLAYENDELVYSEAGYICVHTNVEKRLRELNCVQKIFQAKSLKVWIHDDGNRVLNLDKNALIYLREENKSIERWIEEIGKLKALQNYYDIEFFLKELSPGEETTSLYQNVDIVYRGITMQANMLAEIDRTLLEEDINISEPLSLDYQYNQKKLEKVRIHNYVFIPDEIYLLPISILQKGRKKRQLEYSVRFIAQKTEMAPRD